VVLIGFQIGLDSGIEYRCKTNRRGSTGGGGGMQHIRKQCLMISNENISSDVKVVLWCCGAVVLCIYFLRLREHQSTTKLKPMIGAVENSWTNAKHSSHVTMVLISPRSAKCRS